jgi:hypothetical protein
MWLHRASQLSSSAWPSCKREAEKKKGNEKKREFVLDLGETCMCRVFFVRVNYAIIANQPFLKNLKKKRKTRDK